MQRIENKQTAMIFFENQRGQHGLSVLALSVGLALAGAAGFLPFSAATAQASEGKPAYQQLTNNYVQLPPMQFALAEGAKTLKVELSVILDLPSEVEAAKVSARIPGIINTLDSRIGELDPKELRGPMGTAMVKEVVSAAADRELRPIRVKGVLLQKLILR